jgi:ketosteroid isomerase-like protein
MSESGGVILSRQHMERVIRDYYDACNQADANAILRCFAPDAVHYFPDGAPQGTFVGATAIADGWRGFVQRIGSVWTIDSLVLDEQAGEASIEWTHFKPGAGIRLRGVELCRFGGDGLITEIRAYYACPAAAEPRTHELGDFDYAGRGYPLEAPADVLAHRHPAG